MKLIKSLLILGLLAFIAYTGFWLYVAREMNLAITQFYTIDAPLLGYEFYGTQPHVSGYPYAPTIIYHDGFTKDGVAVTFDRLTIKAFPLPNFPLDARVENLTLSAHRPIFDADHAHINFIIPAGLPAEATKAQLTGWQEQVGTIKLTEIGVEKNNLSLIGTGTIGLDEGLQPTADLTMIMNNYTALITLLSNQISPVQAGIAASVLGAMAKTDEATGERSVQFPVKITNQRLYIGPIKLLNVPDIVWPE